jgi:hypothetical protein
VFASGQCLNAWQNTADQAQDDSQAGQPGQPYDKDFIPVPKDYKHQMVKRTSPAPKQPSTPPRRLPELDSVYAGQRHSWIPETVNVRVMLEHASPPSSTRRYSGSPMNGEPNRQRSIRRTRSRTGLKEYSAQQALQELARESLNGDTRSPMNGDARHSMNGDARHSMNGDIRRSMNGDARR